MDAFWQQQHPYTSLQVIRRAPLACGPFGKLDKGRIAQLWEDSAASPVASLGLRGLGTHPLASWSPWSWPFALGSSEQLANCSSRLSLVRERQILWPAYNPPWYMVSKGLAWFCRFPQRVIMVATIECVFQYLVVTRFKRKIYIVALEI